MEKNQLKKPIIELDNPSPPLKYFMYIEETQNIKEICLKVLKKYKRKFEHKYKLLSEMVK